MRRSCARCSPRIPPRCATTWRWPGVRPREPRSLRRPFVLSQRWSFCSAAAAPTFSNAMQSPHGARPAIWPTPRMRRAGRNRRPRRAAGRADAGTSSVQRARASPTAPPRSSCTSPPTTTSAGTRPPCPCGLGHRLRESNDFLFPVRDVLQKVANDSSRGWAAAGMDRVSDARRAARTHERSSAWVSPESIRWILA
jgi:hypothetical protein